MSYINYQCVVIGASAGGFEALEKMLLGINKKFFLPIIIVQHVSENSKFTLPNLLQGKTLKKVLAVTDKMPIADNNIYIAPPGYHTLVDMSGCFNLSIDPPINHSRPSIDELFCSAAQVYQHQLIAVLLSGADFDGSQGMKEIYNKGGVTIVQCPEEAFSRSMPEAAINNQSVDYVLDANAIASYLNTVADDEESCVDI